MIDDPERYAQRRARLAQCHPERLFLLPGPSAAPGARPASAERQERCLLYLSGLEQSNGALLLGPRAEGDGVRSVLFLPERSRDRERFDGPALGPAEAAEHVGVDEALPLDALAGVLGQWLRGADTLGYRMGVHRRLDDLVLDCLERERQRKPVTGRGLMPIHDPHPAVGELRLHKDEEERRLLRMAAQISAGAHRAAMACAEPGMSELALAGVVEQRLKKGGCKRTAFDTVVAAGARATVLHARPTERELASNELVLIDAAGEYREYASDITRTFPVGACFDSAQARIYALVLAAQQAAIDRIRPGESLSSLHEAAVAALRAGLAALDIDMADEALMAELFPHPTSHWLGLDVHDAGLTASDGQPRLLEQHMALTVEPGLYLPLDDERIPEPLRGIGVRIEDAVLVTENGAEVLTANAPKTIEEIEPLRAAAVPGVAGSPAQ